MGGVNALTGGMNALMGGVNALASRLVVSGQGRSGRAGATAPKLGGRRASGIETAGTGIDTQLQRGKVKSPQKAAGGTNMLGRNVKTSAWKTAATFSKVGLSKNGIPKI